MPPSYCHLLLPSLTLVTLIVVEFHIIVLFLKCGAELVKSPVVTLATHTLSLSSVRQIHPGCPHSMPPSLRGHLKNHFVWLMAWLPLAGNGS